MANRFSSGITIKLPIMRKVQISMLLFVAGFLLAAACLARATNAGKPEIQNSDERTEMARSYILLAKGEGIAAADSIKAAIDEFTKAKFGDKPGTKIRNVVKEAKAAADEAAKKKPDDAAAVKDAVKKKLEALRKQHERNKELRDFVEELMNYLGKMRLLPSAPPGKEGEKPRKQSYNVPDDGFRPSWRFLAGGAITETPVQIAAGPDIENQLKNNFLGKPENFLQLLEGFGGPFVVGDFEGRFPDMELSGKAHIMPGLGVAVELVPNFEIGLRGYYFQREWKGNFPVSVFPSETEPYTVQGEVNASASGLLADIQLRYLFFGKPIGVYVEGGMRGQFGLTNETNAKISGVKTLLEFQPCKDGFAPFGGAGARLLIGRNAFVQAGASFTKWPGGKYGPGGEWSLGWRF